MKPIIVMGNVQNNTFDIQGKIVALHGGNTLYLVQDFIQIFYQF